MATHPRSANPVKLGARRANMAGSIYSDPFMEETKHASRRVRLPPGLIMPEKSAPPDAKEVPSSNFIQWQPTKSHMCSSCQNRLRLSQNFCSRCGAKNPEAKDHGEGEMDRKVFESSTFDTLSTTCSFDADPLERSTAFSTQSFEVTAYKGLPTTLMIRNIPLTYTQEALAAEWPNNGTYDFFYVPCSANMQRNKTYAFINFTSHQAALDFKAQWDKVRLPQFTTRKALSITCADVQGRDENLLQLFKKRHWRLKVKECQPLIYENDVSITLDQAFQGLEGESMQWSL
jgi:hypothetical protein